MAKHKNYPPEIVIKVSKAPKEAPVALIYEPVLDQDGEEDWLEVATTNLDKEEFEIWKKGTMFQKLKMIMEAFKDNIELDEIHAAFR